MHACLSSFVTARCRRYSSEFVGEPWAPAARVKPGAQASTARARHPCVPAIFWSSFPCQRLPRARRDVVGESEAANLGDHGYTPHDQERSETTGQGRGLRTPQGGHDAGLELPQLRSTHSEDAVHGGDAPTDMIGG